MVSSKLESKSNERSIRIRVELDFFAVLAGSNRSRNIERGREVIPDCIEDVLNTLVLISRARPAREDLTGNCFLADSSLDFFDSRLFFPEDLFPDSIIEVGKLLDHGSMIKLGFFNIFCIFSRNFLKRNNLRLPGFGLLSIKIP